MTFIKVDPSLLQSSGQDLQNNARNISSLGGNVLGAAQGAPSYEGQFGPQVAGIGQEAFSRLGNSSNQLNDLGARLSLKGTEFQTADNEAIDQWPTAASFPGMCINQGVIDSSIDKQIASILGLGGGLINAESGFLATGMAIGTVKDWSSVTNLADAAELSNTIDSGMDLLGGSLLDGVGIAIEWGQDYFTYKDRGADTVASAIAVDTGIDLSSIIVGAGIGAVVGGILGNVPGAIIGAKLGAEIGGAFGPIAADWIGPVKAWKESEINLLSVE